MRPLWLRDVLSGIDALEQSRIRQSDSSLRRLTGQSVSVVAANPVQGEMS